MRGGSSSSDFSRNTASEIMLPEGDPVRAFLVFLGHPFTALIIATLLATLVVLAAMPAAVMTTILATEFKAQAVELAELGIRQHQAIGLAGIASGPQQQADALHPPEVVDADRDSLDGLVADGSWPLTFTGLQAMLDPPRAAATSAVTTLAPSTFTPPPLVICRTIW